MARLFLVRHGETQQNNAHMFLGHTDAELSAEGTRQAARLAERLSGQQFDAVYSSDLKRAMATAEAVCGARGAAIIRCPELREINYGDAECLTYAQIKAKYPGLADQINKLSPELRFPGGESLAGFIERTLRFKDRLDLKASNLKVLVVSHGGAIRTLLCDLLGVDQSHWRSFRLDNTSLSIVDTYSELAILSLLNDTSHLNRGPSEGL